MLQGSTVVNMAEKVQMESSNSIISGDWKKYLDACLSSSSSSFEIANLHKELQENNVKLYTLVEELQPYLTSTDNIVRQKGTKLLADVLHYTEKDSVSRKEVEVLVIFFIDRLKDHHSVVPHVLYGLLALAKMENLQAEQVEKILRGIFSEVYIPSLLQTERFCTFQLVSHLIQNRITELQQMGPDFVLGFVQMLDGERDPRCLLLALHIVPLIVQNINIGPFVEEMFEVVACYFPVDFTPPSDDEQGITREELSLALRKCLASTSKFSQYALPLFLEKLDSDIQNSKVEALNTLAACCEHYTVEDLKPYLSAIWSGIRKEVIDRRDEDVESAALIALSIVIRTITSSETELILVAEFLEDIWKECERLLIDREANLICSSSKLLKAVAQSSYIAFSKIVPRVIPLLLQQYTLSPQECEKPNILDILNQFIDILKDFSSHENDQNTVLELKDSVLALYFSVLTSEVEKLQVVGLQGLSNAILAPQLMEHKHCELLADHLLHLCLSEKCKTVREHSVNLIFKLTFHYPHITKEKIIPHLVNCLSSGSSGDVGKTNFVFDSLAAAANHSSTFHIIVPLLVKYIKENKVAIQIQNRVEATQCLLKIVKCVVVDTDCALFLYESCFSHLLCFCLDMCQDTNLSKNSVTLVEEISHVLQVISQQLDTSLGSTAIPALVQVVLQGTTPKSHENNGNDLNIGSLYQVESIKQYLVLTLFRAVVCNVRKDTIIPQQKELLQVLSDLMILEDSNVSVTASQCAAALINKMEAGANFSLCLSTITQKLKMTAENTTKKEARESAVKGWSWLTKALILRGDSQLEYLVEKLISWLEDEFLGKTAADGFIIVLQEVPEVLNQSSHANVKILYSQRFFLSTLPELLKNFNEAQPAETCRSGNMKILQYYLKISLTKGPLYGGTCVMQKENCLY
ncbi:MMS19 nucleotide excision repair protein isoform X3 [Tachypleus tridentatus]|uniref:MMS19 nucleotide excision repair protein isoform X3 n=1 Tax=Tachypleus tridentatus TaxID=6853 RepID=UPI003FD4F526